MKTDSLTIKTLRNLDEKTYFKFKGRCAELQLSMGQEVTELLKSWLQNKQR